VDAQTRILRLPDKDLLELHRNIGEHLEVVGIEDARSKGLDRAGQLSLTDRAHDATARELGLEYPSSRVIRAYLTWRNACLVLAGEKLPRDGLASAASKARAGANQPEREAAERCLQLWLASKPRDLTTKRTWRFGHPSTDLLSLGRRFSSRIGRSPRSTSCPGLASLESRKGRIGGWLGITIACVLAAAVALAIHVRRRGRGGGC
jgi:hypothetical protein